MPSDKALHRQQVLNQADYVYVRGPQDYHMLKNTVLILEQAPALGVDTETTGLDPMVDTVRLIQVASEELALIVDVHGFRDQDGAIDWDFLSPLKGLLESKKLKVLQNAAFDINFLLRACVSLKGVIFDTMIASSVINNGSPGVKNDLGSIVKRYLKYDLPKELQKADWSGPITEEMLQYAARDAICLPHLMPVLEFALMESWVKEDCTLYDIFKLEMRVLWPVALMQYHGFLFDSKSAVELETALELKAAGLKQAFLENLDQHMKQRHPNQPDAWLPRNADGSVNTRAKESGSLRLGTKLYAGFNPSSTQQMAAAFTKAGIILPPNAEGNTSLDQNLLSFIRSKYELVDQYLTWKSAANQVTNIQKLIESTGPDGAIHAGYRQTGTKTGRLSCAGPNLQQVDRSPEFRSKFISPHGCVLVVADFSQVELRVAAELSEEQRMLDAYRAGRDLHTETATLITGVESDKITKAQRTSAKIANFGLLYGAGPATLRKQAMAEYGIEMSDSEAKEIVDGFRAAYPQLYEWQQREGSRTTASVLTLLGRRRILKGFDDKYTTRINTQVQGTAGDIAKKAISLIWKEIVRLPGEAKLIAMIHDEIVLEVQEDVKEQWAQRLKDCMEQAGASVCSKVPIVAEVAYGPTWADAK
jgi:DNA polymerase I-like protein with 3'-5' exonuclease and polymerase domains